MQSSSALMPVSIFLVRSVGKLQTSKFMTAASKVSVTQKILQPVSVRCSGADRHALDCVWGHDHIQNSILNDYSDKNYEMEVEKLKQRIRLMLQNVSAPAKQLELIDDLQRLGVAYHFDKEIKIILERIYKSEDYWAETDLHTAALTFRLLRQNGYFVTQDIFKSFINNDSGIFKLSLREDIKGMLSLYEASYLSIEGETIMEQALDFTTACFRNLKISKKLVTDTYLSTLLTHALELPLHWRTQRLEARWFIDIYPTKHDTYPCLLQLAKLDFNMVQGMYRDELKDLSRWWENLGLTKVMDFVRDSLVISYIWSATIYWEPEYESSRKVFTQAVALLTTMDDVYEVNGTLDELELFTSTVERWDVEAMLDLPHHLKMCFLALYNFINESTYLCLNKKGFYSLPTLRNTWITLLRSYLNEARWYHQGYQPTLEEYMSNARISVGVYSMTIHAYIFDPKPVSEAELKYLESDPEILKWAAVIFRVCNDLGTSPEELKSGDTPKSVQCHMHDTRASKEVAEVQIRDLVRKGWKEMNTIRYKTEMIMQWRTIDKFLDTARASLRIYQYMNRNGMQDSMTKDLISKILHDPISL